MEILVTGNIKWLKNDFWEILAKQNQVIVCAEGTDAIKGNNISTYQIGIGQPEFEQLFLTYNIDYVVMLSGRFDQDTYDEIRYVDQILAICRKSGRTKIIYICPSKQITVCYGETHTIVEDACDRMCGMFCAEGGNLLKLTVPYLVSATQGNDFFDAFYQSMEEAGRIVLIYHQEHSMDFLFGSDLASFLNIVTEENVSGYEHYRLYGGNEMTAGELAGLIVKAAERNEEGITISFGSAYREREQGFEKDRQEIRSRYGWFPREKLADRVGEWYADCQKKKKPKWRKKGTVTACGKRLYLFEIAVLFAVCEILTAKTRYMQLVDFADFRLFCVAIAGMMYGLRYGMIAAVATCVAYLIGVGGGASWQIQFYNIINWLPFATYLLTGAIAGYTRDKYQDQIENLTKSRKIMEDKYIYLNQMYGKALADKERYGRQIINYKDSLGHIYAATKKLSSMHAEEILRQAVSVLEEMMETQSAAIYLIDSGSQARLCACSERMAKRLDQTICLDDLPECMHELEKSGSWINRAFLKGQPDYAYGIYRDHVLLGMITILEVQHRQMSLEYRNRFQIVSEMIRDAFLRAVDYEKAIGYESQVQLRAEQYDGKEKET